MLDYIFRELAVSYLGRHDLAHVVPHHDEDLGGGEQEGGRARETSKDYLSKVTSSGFVRGQLNQLVVVRGGNTLQKIEAHAEGAMLEHSFEEDPEVNIGERLADIGALLRDAAADNPVATVRASLETHFAPDARSAPAKSGSHKREVHAKRAAEARLKGYEGDACGSCGNFTLLRNGTCMKCDTCGGTSGCS